MIKLLPVTLLVDSGHMDVNCFGGHMDVNSLGGHLDVNSLGGHMDVNCFGGHMDVNCQVSQFTNFQMCLMT